MTELERVAELKTAVRVTEIGSVAKRRAKMQQRSVSS
jgi:hypothetical protein